MASPVASNWYETKSLSDGVSLVRETHVASWLRCNIWHVSGRTHDLIIDTGMGVRPLKKEVSLITNKPVICVSTHAHFDHIGGAHEFDCRLGHHLEAAIHAAPDEQNTAGWSAFVRAETFTALPCDNYDFNTYHIKPAALTGYLDEGDVVDLGNRHFSILHLPGHSPGSIALYEEASGILFSGDTIYDGALFDTVYHSNKEAYQQSLRRLKTLPVKTVHGGHDQSFSQDRMITLIDDYLAGNNRLGDPGDWVSKQISGD